MLSRRGQVPRIVAFIVVICIFQTFFVSDFLGELCFNNDIRTRGTPPGRQAKKIALVASNTSLNTTSSHPTIFLFRDFPKRKSQNQGPAIYFSLDDNTFGGVKARSFEPWRGDAVPCLKPEPTWKQHDTQISPTREGFLFLKTFKTGSSTASGVHLRIARNAAKRRKTGFEVCKARFDHAWASSIYQSLDRNMSFLWTIVREPRGRAISQLFHFHVSREQQPSTDESLVARIRNDTAMFRDYYVSSLSLNGFQPKRSDPVQTANEIIRQHDFIAITERMDESVVALAMLLKVPLADVLYLKAKGKGDYDDAGKGGLCTIIHPAFVSEGMQAFFQSKEYQDMVHWDYLLYQAANKSLDMTIDALGRVKFARNLSRFRQAQEEATTRCLPTTRFPCSEEGELRNETDCLWKDSACGLDCLDQVSTESNLW
eukprot:scaffold1697_cov180-Amphora_coffeaeformis.AAC.24